MKPLIIFRLFKQLKHVFVATACLIWFFIFSSSAYAATFRLSPPNHSLLVDSTVDVTMTIDTEGKEVLSADATISYDPSILEVVKIERGSFFPKNLSRVSPNTVSLAGGSPETPHSGTGILGVITFRGRTLGVSSLIFRCKPHTFTDATNIEDTEGEDIVDCTHLTSGVYTVASTPQFFTQGESSTSETNPSSQSNPVIAITSQYILPRLTPTSTPKISKKILPSSSPTHAEKQVLGEQTTPSNPYLLWSIVSFVVGVTVFGIVLRI